MASETADQINSIIEHAINVADAKSADAALYASRALAATDTIQYIEGSGDVTGPSLPALMTVPDAILPSVDLSTVEDFPALIGEIKAMVSSQFTDFFGEYFPNDIIAHSNAVTNLAQLADRANAEIAMDRLNTRATADVGARSFLNDRFTYASEATQRLREDMARGGDGTGYLSNKLNGGNQATNWLLAKFAVGDQATTVLLQMLAGGSGIPTAVEDQIYQRDRSRLLNEAARVEQQAIDSMAARGYPLPPGAAIMMRYQTQSDAQDKIAQASRDVAIKQVDTLLENIRSSSKALLGDASQSGQITLEGASTAARALVENSAAASRVTLDNAQQAARILIEDALASTRILVETAQRSSELLMKLRTDALQATADYVKTIVSGASAAADVQRAVIDGRERAAESIVRYYTARVQAAATYNNAAAALADVQLKPLLASADNRVRLHMAKGTTDVGIANAKSNAALGAATAAGNQGAAALSTLNGIASLTSAS